MSQSRIGFFAQKTTVLATLAGTYFVKTISAEDIQYNVFKIAQWNASRPTNCSNPINLDPESELLLGLKLLFLGLSVLSVRCCIKKFCHDTAPDLSDISWQQAAIELNTKDDSSDEEKKSAPDMSYQLMEEGKSSFSRQP